MFEENKNINEFDQMIKSILDEGQEEVPARVWEGVSEGLDKAARRKTVVLWWRRTAISIAAAAAVTVAVIFNIRPETDMIRESAGNGLIAVVEPEKNSEDPVQEVMADVIVTPAPKAADKAPRTASEAIILSDAAPEVAEEPVDTETITTEESDSQIPVADKTETPKAAVTASEEYYPEDWGEEDVKEKRDISFILSGLASTNSTQNKNRMGPMKAPTITSAPKETGVTETSTNSTYGLPVSFGAGIRLGLSDRWSLGTGLNYSLLTRQFYGKYIKVDAEGSIEQLTSSDIRNTQHFIGVPFNAYYNFVNKDRINMYAYAGATVEKCISDNYSVLSTSIRHKEAVKGVQLSANAGIGVEFMLGRHLGLYIDPSVRYYFDCGQPKSIRTVQPLMLGFEMGIRARL